MLNSRDSGKLKVRYFLFEGSVISNFIHGKKYPSH